MRNVPPIIKIGYSIKIHMHFTCLPIKFLTAPVLR